METSRPAVATGTESWKRKAAEGERGGVWGFLEKVTESDTIQAAKKLSLSQMRVEPAGIVLEVGCGTGAFFPEVASALQSTGLIVGIDHAAGFLADAAERAANAGFSEQLTLAQADAHHLPFAANVFLAAHIERVLMHLKDPDQALREIVRVLKPGGWVVCVEPDLVGMRLDVDVEIDED